MSICKNCGKEFEEKYSKWSDGNFCCKQCARSYSSKEKRQEINANVSKTLKEYFKTHQHPHLGKPNPRKGMITLVDWKCPYCGKTIKIKSALAKKRKFCSGTCRNIHNNKLINGSRSKAEDILYQRLIEEFPTLQIIRNDRNTLNGLEIDIFIPSLKIGIEWNGIFHYKDVHNNGKLQIIQEKDNLKKQICLEKGIELLVIQDLTSNKKFIFNEVEKIISLIQTKIIGV